MLNIVISFVLEIYGSIEDEMEVEERKKALARRLMARFKDDPDGIELAEFVHQVAAEERRMIFGVNYEGDEFLDQITRKESGAERTMEGRRNSMDALFSNKADQSKEKKRKSGLVNRTQSQGESPTENSPMISVKRMRTRNMYEDIPESDEESKSTIKTDSELITMNTSQRDKL